jgi:putative ABC transport system permease protein
MFRNYLVTALRNIIRHKLYSLLNIAGLAVALTCVILIAVFVSDEFSYDKWIPGADRLWRVEVTHHLQGKPDLPTTQASMPMLTAMREQIPEVRTATRLVQERMALSLGNRRFIQTAAVVDPNFLKVIPLSLIRGPASAVLSQPDSVVISQSVARKFFGDTDPIGQSLTAENAACQPGANSCDTSVVPLKVTGVMQDLPDNTQFDFDVLVPNTSRADQMEQRLKSIWLNTGHIFGYVTLASGADPARVLAKLKTIMDRSIDTSRYRARKVLASKMVEPRLTPFLQVHLTSDNYVGAMKPAGDWPMLYGLMVIGCLILLVACFNFMNLATARATLRAREIALRKCAGARRSQLIMQFLCESVLMAFLALVIALALAETLVPLFGQFMGRSLTTHYFTQWQLTLGLIGVCLLAGLFSGSYPALVLSRLRPAAGLRAGMAGGNRTGHVRTLLVTLQFAVSISLGLGALVVSRQIEFVRQIDLGFDRGNVVFASTGGHLPEAGIQSLVETLKRGPGILDVARTYDEPFHSGGSFAGLQNVGSSELLTPNWVFISQNYFDLYRIKLVTGRSLSDTREEDTYYDMDNSRNEGHNVMVNVALARALGFSAQDIVGKIILMRNVHVKVVGVVSNTLVDGAHRPAAQAVYSHTPEDLPSVAIRLAPGHIEQGVAYVNKTLRQFLPTTLPTAVFLDDTYDRLYQSDRRQGEIFTIFVGIAVFIACLGMFGLAAFTAGRRTKEIGIRKVFGARLRHVVALLLWQFSIPVVIANLLAWPIAWIFLQRWLQTFAYRIALSPVYFVVVGLAALLIAWATILTHTMRVARAKPIHALRYE